MKGPFVPLSVSYRENHKVFAAGGLAELMFVRSLAFSKQHRTAGHISRVHLRLLCFDLESEFDADGDSIAGRLVDVGLWHAVDDGWLIDGWADWNSIDSSRAGSLGNHIRWHVQRDEVDPECDHCAADDRGESPPIAPEIAPDRVANRQGIASKRQSKSKKTPPSQERREDVDHLCDLMAELMVNNGCRRPNVTTAWRDEARRLLDRDGVPLSEAERVMRWALADPFWKSNVLSIPKFREKFDALKIKANGSRPEPPPRLDFHGNRIVS